MPPATEPVPALTAQVLPPTVAQPPRIVVAPFAVVVVTEVLVLSVRSIVPPTLRVRPPMFSVTDAAPVPTVWEMNELPGLMLVPLNDWLLTVAFLPVAVRV